MTRQEAQVIVNTLSVKKCLDGAEKARLMAALNVLANKWSLPS